MLAGVPTAQAADTTLTLACEGIETSQWGSGPKSSEKVNIGIIVDLQKKTVMAWSQQLHSPSMTSQKQRSPLAECRAAGITKVSLGI
jgi:hypothetical protein